MKRTITTALVCLLMAGPAAADITTVTPETGTGQAQPGKAAQASPTANGYDFDTLIACSLVYARIAELYGNKGDKQDQLSFMNTANAYSASALHQLQYSYQDPAQAYTYSQTRMGQVRDSLNQSIKDNPKGENGVLKTWMPYCDSLGSGVSKILKERQARGW